MRVATAQLEATADTARNLETIARLVRRATAERAQLVVLPEEAMFSAPDDRPLADTAEPLDGPFVQGLTELAHAGSLTIVAGMHERGGALGTTRSSWSGRTACSAPTASCTCSTPWASARAIETTCWVAASDQAGAHFVGRSMLIDPMGVV